MERRDRVPFFQIKAIHSLGFKEPQGRKALAGIACACINNMFQVLWRVNSEREGCIIGLQTKEKK